MGEYGTIRHATSGRRLVVAGGGTGGHLFPGIAVAQAFKTLRPGNQVLFINGGRPLEKQVLARLGWDQQAIDIQGLKGRGLWRQVRVVSKLPGAVIASARWLKAFGADMVFGVGGYAAGPVVTAAWLMGKATAIHEQNRLPGVTNRLLSKIVKRVYVSFDDSRSYFNPRKVLVSGNPVRDDILALAAEHPTASEKQGFAVLVIGGSQGARAINDAMIEALPVLKSVRGLSVVHQTGGDDEARVLAAYRQAGIRAEVKAFFNDMAGRYKDTDLIVCRAGATTVAEITVVGRAAIFIPFPFAADDHQTRNAQALVEAGAARMIAQSDLVGDRLADTIIDLMNTPGRMAQMAARAKALGRPEAARDIVNDLYALIGENTSKTGDHVTQ